jgi:hypothetical protein
MSSSENKARGKEIDPDNIRDDIFFDGSLASVFPLKK